MVRLLLTEADIRRQVKDYLTLKNCLQCGKEYSVKPSRVLKSKYCSRECMAKAYKDTLRGQNNPNWRGGNIEVICQLCGETFDDYPSRAGDRKYCSKICKDKAEVIYNEHCVNCNKKLPSTYVYAGSKFCSMNCRRQHIKNKKIENGAPDKCAACGSDLPVKRMGEGKYCSWDCYMSTRSREKEVTKKCPACGDLFKTSSFKSRETVYCSSPCHRKKQSLRQYGSGSHYWKGGRVQGIRRLRSHPLYKEWRKTVFERDGYTCQHCLTRGGKLAAHHIVAVSEDPRKALRVSNGLTLCWNCHKVLHQKIRAQKLEAL